jgi:dienelactone hydrolase
MRLRILPVFALAMALGGCLPSPAPPETPSGPAGAEADAAGDRAQLWWVPVQPYGNTDRTFLLETMVYRPEGAGPFPLVTINHGLPVDKSRLRETRPAFERAAHWWVGHGYAVAVPLRRGVGRSQGDFVETTGDCTADDFTRRAYLAALDMKGVARYLATQAFVDPHRIVIVGQSVGGFASLAVSADPPPGVVAVVDFAGGIGGRGNGEICGGAAGLIDSARQLGARAKAPELWLFAANDRWFGAFAQPMFEAYRAGTKVPVGFVGLPPFGTDGHATLYRADPDVWGPSVEAFLQTVPALARPAS